MVHLIQSDETGKTTTICNKAECKTRTGCMLKCSRFDCNKQFHLSCVSLTEEEATDLVIWFCSDWCKAYSDPVKLREKYIAQKELLSRTTKTINEYQQVFKSQASKLGELKTTVENLKKENSRIPQLEEEISRLKEELKNKKDELNKSNDSIADLLENESDEELKKNLTSAFKLSCPSVLYARSSSPKPRDSSSKKDVSQMTESEKLTYYQRLHVQRLEVPKLMKYSGSAAEWLSFKSAYERLREKGEYDNETMIEKLRESLSGDAEKYVKQRLNQPFANADNIMEVLKKKFFQPKEAVANALIKLETWKQIPEKSRKDLEEFLLEIDDYIYLCKTLNFRPELEVSINSRITGKLPYDMELKWQQRIAEKKIKGNIVEMSTFLWAIVPNLPSRESTKRTATVNFTQPSTSSNKNNNKPSVSPKPKRTCWYCGNNIKHPLYRCPGFKELSYEDKTIWLSTNKICSRCLASNQHAAINCTRAEKIPKCAKKNCEDPASHCSLMHPTKGSEASATQLHVGIIARTMFKIVPIFVFDSLGNRVETTLLMDRAAGASLVNKEFFEKLGIHGESYHLQLNWLQPDASHPDTNAIRHDLKIAPIHDPSRVITLHDMSALDGVILPQQEQNPRALKSEFPYLRNAKIPSFTRQRPQILLGLPHSKWMVSLETIYDDTQESAPIAEKTPLGWTVSGSHWSSRSIFHVCESSQDECLHSEIDSNETTTLTELHETIKHFHSFEMMGIYNDKKYLSRDDAKALQIMRHTMRQIGKRYEIGLYWKDDNCVLPDNYQTALNRLKTTEKRLKKLNMIEWANDHQKLLRELGFVRKATKDDLEPVIPHKRINYVIGFVTFNQNKQPPKARWVVDTASKHQGVSLNSNLLKGPDNLIPLTQALFHFRERPIATVGDVTKMYHQILIRKEDQQVQRFLWRDCDDTREPTIYIFQSMLFGPTCSPSQANSVRIDVAKKLRGKYPNGSRVALTSMYMDDEFNSEDTPDEAAAAAKETIALFKTISWESVDFKSNSEATLQQLPTENVDSELILDLGSEDEILSRKVLGLHWNPKTDTFAFKVAKNVEMITWTLNENYRPTKLEVLSFIMRIFDCLGLISHFVIRGKMILQSIWKIGIGWRQKIPDEINEAWKRWIEKFDEIERLQIPRHYGYDSRYSKNVTLHVFVDASLEAYAAVAFIRFELNGVIKVCQIMGKCRVAPVKYASVPKLELMAAVVGARLAITIKEQHTRLKFEATTFWSDSITVLRWLYSPSIRLQQFVAPRISEIQEISCVNDWRYVPTNQNVADDGTKWNDIDFSSPAQRWLIGPKFLYEDERDWPAKFPENVNINEHRILIAAINVDDKNQSPYYAGIIDGVSSKIRANWKNYRMVIAWIRRFANNILSKWKLSKKTANADETKTNTSEIISPEEIHDAEHYIYREIQKSIFKDEFNSLAKGLSVKQTSKLYSLNAFLDADGLIKSKTRMYLEESLPYDLRCPPILPNKHETTHSLLTYIHENNNHVGAEGVAAQSRSKVWIIHVKSAVQRVRMRCLYCITQRAKQQFPPVAPLPRFRLTATTKAFEYCGVDCAGPFTIYAGNSYVKKEIWVVLFTCLITRAVYLRKLDAMTADEMLLAIQDVWTRRGPIRKMYSDNGGNFIGSSRIIKANHLQKLAEEKNLEWFFNPAWTPHWGGAWERLIREMKRSLKVVMKNKIVKEKIFDCALLQTEDLLNSRPLTNVPVSPDDLIPLTPNYLVKLHPGYAFVEKQVENNDEYPNLYIKKAKKISDQLISRWIKEYLSSIADPKLKGQNKLGLNVDDLVIYMDPLVKPENWKRGRVIEVSRGRDGFARIANIKLSNGDVLEKRSVSRLAKLLIDEENFTKTSCLLLKISERTLAGQDQDQVQIKNKSFKSQKLNDFMLKMSMMNDLPAIAVMRLWNELGQASFVSREQVAAKSGGNSSAICETIEETNFLDTTNTRTIKINRIPTNSCFFELLTSVAKHDWTVSMIVADSIEQKEGFFAYLTFDKESTKVAAMESGYIELAGKRCKLSEPQKAMNPLKLAGMEYGFVFWNHKRIANCPIILCRQKDTMTRENALPRFSNTHFTDYKEYLHHIDMSFGTESSDDPKMHVREEEAANQRQIRKSSDRRKIIPPKGSSSGEQRK